MSSSMVSSKTSLPAVAGYGGDGEGGSVDAASSAAPVTSCLYLHPGAGTLDKDAVLRRIRHRRRHNRLRDTLRSMLQAPPPPQETENMDGGAAERHLPWPLDDAFSAP
ncbi:hypothetical protein SETIT_3G374000v2 [Setaria italica]|uniref:Uncharacterized protein n=1 Tax=Setaria italica TaxID=4555 RepID=A0A368QNB3_SETIT|nr:uncharacterized protein LOC101783889 [Setaria italica]RCV19304.1 hypothetical protein SETIT_3G374000v2 [Setaria italica]